MGEISVIRTAFGTTFRALARRSRRQSTYLHDLA